jgi:hypothetical protein
MNTQCGYLRTAIGKPTRATVADICSYFAQAAQSGTEEGPSGAYEAPMTIAEMRQRSISNVLSNERVSVTLQSYYFMPTDNRQEMIAKETVRQIVKNGQLGDDDELEMLQAVAAGGTHSQRNARISHAVARQRARAAAEARHIESTFGSLGSSTQKRKKNFYIPQSLSKSNRRINRKRKHNIEKEKMNYIKHLRGNGLSEKAKRYAIAYPGVIHSPNSSEKNCLIRAIAYTLAYNMIINRECDGKFIPKSYNRSTNTRMAQLKCDSIVLYRLIGYLTITWRKENNGGSNEVPVTIEDAEKLMKICPLLFKYSLHIAIVRYNNHI